MFFFKVIFLCFNCVFFSYVFLFLFLFLGGYFSMFFDGFLFVSMFLMVISYRCVFVRCFWKGFLCGPNRFVYPAFANFW